MLLATVLWPVPLRRRAIAIVTALCAIVVGWESVRLGPMFHVWWRQDVSSHRLSASVFCFAESDLSPRQSAKSMRRDDTAFLWS